MSVVNATTPPRLSAANQRRRLRRRGHLLARRQRQLGGGRGSSIEVTAGHQRQRLRENFAAPVLLPQLLLFGC